MSHGSDTYIVPLLSAQDRDGHYSDSDAVGNRDVGHPTDETELPWTAHKHLDGHPSTRGRPNSRRSFVAIVFIVVGGIVLAVSAAYQIDYRVSDLHRAFSGLTRTGPPSHSQGPVAVEQAKGLDWSGESELWRSYEWAPRSPHESLTKMVEALTKEEAQVRRWLLSTRPISQSGTPVGLSQSSPAPAPIREGPAMIRVQRGLGGYTNGSRLKYESLRTEWQTGRQVSQCRNTSWMADYATLHREILNGDRPPKILEVVCPKGAICGGSSDRLFGLYSLFLYAVLTDRALLVTWADLPFELLYDAVRIDWAQPYMPNSGRSIHPGLATLEAEFLNITNPERLPKVGDHSMSGLERLLALTLFQEKRDDPWIQAQMNRGAAINSFGFASVEPTLRARGFDPETVYTCMTDFLIRPKINALRFITEYDSLFSLPTVFSIAIQIRTGDKSFDHRKDQGNTVDVHRNFFACADKIAERFARHDQKVIYYLVTDSRALEEDALLHLSDRIVVTGLTQAHPELHSEVTDAEEIRLLDGASNAQVEDWIIGKTDFQIITRLSGFGKLPVFIKGVEGATVSLTRAGGHMSSLGKQTSQDCSRLDSLSSLAQLASTWSMG
ncbi:hypothetical protein MVLG_04507 [Microbotryum lychnidis-dioicae p1A1 Lamole]|uniref:Uncharacterized protein n=1 Tax=Microbotryum lychnidis-dioicae (strain p1A1 Lamole / MvSl-1064) TaxID=683840 RepID=U5HBF6_USTV1|nr:hypothetical protein MVLG_04507 [Microbotryum lychnidis-dioicae p1A1 Lamole]|eukprot:KDE05066.1 hypothetical protein MVLG_04507 [Microbotryum lychnidis-dioicae p1A1 Lamole]